MGRIVRLTESDLHRIVKRAINESNRNKNNRISEQELNPETLTTGEAILTMVLTTIGLLGIAGSHYIKAMIDKLRDKGEDEKADEVQSALDSVMSEKSSEEDIF